MIVIAHFPQQRAAQIFADYCATQGWAVQVEAAGVEGAKLLVAAPVFDLVHQELLYFQKNPADPRYQGAAWQLSAPRDIPRPSSLLPFWRRLRAATGPLTLLVCALCLVVYLLLQLLPQLVLDTLSPTATHNAEWLSLRWLTPAFLHFSIEHLAFNLLAWLIYAGRVERQLGSRFLLGFLFVTAVSSNLLQWWVIGPNFGGLSGVCFALFGFAWVYGMRYPQQVLKAERSDVVVSVIFLGLGFADLLWVNTANYAHLGGLIVGLLLALFPFKPAKPMAS
jgi:GlpG protein